MQSWIRSSQIRTAALSAAVVLSAVACGSKPHPAPESRVQAAGGVLKEGMDAPDFELKDVDGKPVKLSDLKGKVVLLNFWATWCSPCKFEIPWFIEFERTYKDRGFAVVGVSMDEEGWEVVEPYLIEMRVNYRVVIGDEKLDKLYGGGEGIKNLPTTFIIDKRGKIASIHVGLAPKKAFEDDIQKLLN